MYRNLVALNKYEISTIIIDESAQRIIRHVTRNSCRSSDATESGKHAGWGHPMTTISFEPIQSSLQQITKNVISHSESDRLTGHPCSKVFTSKSWTEEISQSLPHKCPPTMRSWVLSISYGDETYIRWIHGDEAKWADSPKGLVMNKSPCHAEAIMLKHGQRAGDELSAVHLSSSLCMSNYAPCLLRDLESESPPPEASSRAG